MTKTGKRIRKSPKKAKPGAFWVLEEMGAVENGSNQMRKPSVRTKVNHKTMQHMKKRKPAETQSFRRFCGRGSRDRRGRAPLALAHPSARGFGVDVGEHNGEQKRAGVARFFPQVTK